jgi:hypothetical protein
MSASLCDWCVLGAMADTACSRTKNAPAVANRWREGDLPLLNGNLSGSNLGLYEK